MPGRNGRFGMPLLPSPSSHDPWPDPAHRPLRTAPPPRGVREGRRARDRSHPVLRPPPAVGGRLQPGGHRGAGGALRAGRRADPAERHRAHRGHTAARETLGRLMEERTQRLLLTHQRSAGNVGHVQGGWQARRRDTTGGPLLATGTYIMLFERAPDGRWHIVYHAWTQDRNAAPA